VPGGRSGHSFTNVGNSVYFLYGGIESDAKTGNVAPNNDVYIMRMGGKAGKYFYNFVNLTNTSIYLISFKPIKHAFNFKLEDLPKTHYTYNFCGNLKYTYIFSCYTNSNLFTFKSIFIINFELILKIKTILN